MTTLAKHIAYMVILVVTLFSCNQNPSLQTYYVDNQEKPNFLSVDIPANFLNLDMSSLTAEQKEAYESIEKLNMLAYRLNANNEAEYNTELQKVKTILEDPKYEELMRGGNAVDGKFVIKILGEEDDIEEFILFGSSNDKGFAIVRVLGDEMNPMKIMNLVSALDKANIDDGQAQEFMNFFK